MIRYHSIAYSTTSVRVAENDIGDAAVRPTMGGANSAKKRTTFGATLAKPHKMTLPIKKYPADFPQAGPEVQQFPN